jgi:hypothetical protein
MRPILTSEAMKEAMRHRFVLAHYKREQHQNLEEIIFECQNYLEEKKVKLVAVEFTGYATFWRD